MCAGDDRRRVHPKPTANPERPRRRIGGERRREGAGPAAARPDDGTANKLINDVMPDRGRYIMLTDQFFGRMG
jgi:hypothetical protein